MFYLAGIIITFFLSILLAGKKGKSEGDKILTVWLVIVGFHLTAFYLYLSGKYVRFPWFLGLELPLPLVHGPFLFLYITALTQARKIRAKDLLHFFPVLLIYMLMLPFFQLSTEQKILIYKQGGSGYEWLTGPVSIAVYLSGVIYVILCFLELRKHRINIENKFSNTARINLNWLRYLIYGTSVIWVVILLGLNDVYVFGTVVLYVFFIGYFGIKQVGIFSNMPFSKENLVIKEEVKSSKTNFQNDPGGAIQSVTRPKYLRSSLTEEEAKKIHGHLQQLMTRDKLFKDPELNLGELAGKLNVHSNILSQVINTFESKTFYDYINFLRIDEFKNLLTDPGNNQYTLLSLAFECGFNSKTAFNRNFRKVTGLSPSEYLNHAKINLA